MAFIVEDRVKETTSTTGTGDLSLNGATNGFRAFGDVMSDGDTCPYALSDTNSGDYEVGIATYNASADSLTRTTVQRSSNSNSAVDLNSGVKTVAISGIATRLPVLNADPSSDQVMRYDGSEWNPISTLDKAQIPSATAYEDEANTFTEQQAFEPGSAQAPFTLNANAQQKTVTGLRADEIPTSYVNSPLTGGDGTALGLDETSVDHDNLQNYVANEHLDWTADQGATNIDPNNFPHDHTEASLSSIPNAGLANDTVAVAGNSVALGGSTPVAAEDLSNVDVTTPAAGQLLIYHATNGQFETASITDGNGIVSTEADASLTLAVDLVASGGLQFNSGEVEVDESNVAHDSLSGFVANEHIDHSGVSISSGDGLTGGGDITATRTLSADADTGISVSASGIALDESYAATITSGWTWDTGAGANLQVDETGIYYSTASAETLNLRNAGTGSITVQQDGTAVVLETRSLTGGNAIDAIGDLSADRTIAVSTDGIGIDEIDLSIAPTWTGNHTYGDSTKVQWGAGQDASMQWDGTDLLFDYDAQNAGTSSLRIQQNGGNRLVVNSNGDVLDGNGNVIYDRSANVVGTDRVTSDSIATDAIGNDELDNSDSFTASGLSLSSGTLGLPNGTTVNDISTTIQKDETSRSDNALVTEAAVTDLDSRFYPQSTADVLFITRSGDQMNGPLYIIGADTTSDGGTTDSPTFRLRATYDSDGTSSVTSADYDATFQHIMEGTGPTSRIAVSIDGTEHLSIAQNGNFGFGTVTDPSELLQLADAGNIEVGTSTGTKIGTSTSQKLGFFGATPVTQQSAYTQTFSTTDRTHAARTAASLTDNTGGTAADSIPSVSGTGDDSNINNIIASLVDEINKLRDDQRDTASVLNAAVDDLQTFGFAG